MGTGFDCFDTLSHALDPRIQGEARENRLLLERTLEDAGFTNYALEWWHLHAPRRAVPGGLLRVPGLRAAALR